MRSLTWRYFDYILFGAVLILIIFGIAMIRSAIAGNTVLTPLINRQILFAAASLVVIFITAAIDYHYWSSLIRPMYIITVVALAILTVVGQAIYGSARWFDTGVILIQPSELAKIVLILALADYYAHSRDKPHNFRWIAQSFLTMFFIAVWIALQPNLSTTIVMIVLWFGLLWLSGLPTKYLITFILVGMIGVVIAFPLLEPYQQGRIINFVLPDESARHGDTYNVDQARITIGSGGWTGMGYGLGTQVQLRFLKVRHTDFIFSAIGEEFGFLGMLALLGFLVLVILRCLRAAQLAQDAFGSYIAYGFTILILFQAAVNIGVNLNLIPVTGLTLPFVSYGGSSLLSLSLGIGLVESVILRHKPD
ncbi:MAG: rod shape-determining protein RodA [Anaerolineaceae bacterium]|nr:rod shape-determining protein RodA [Anaerolineaceae bacterium]